MRGTILLGFLCCLGCEDCDCRGTIEGAQSLAAEAREEITAADRERIAELAPATERFLATHPALLDRIGSLESFEAATVGGFPLLVAGSVGAAAAVEIAYDVRGPRGEVKLVRVGFVQEGDVWVAKRAYVIGDPSLDFGDPSFEVVMPSSGGGGSWD